MKLVLKVAASILALLMVVGFLNGLAEGDNPDPKRVVKIGESRLPIPDDTPHNIFAVTRVMMKEVGFEAWYRNCIVGQAERLLVPQEARELGHDPQGQLRLILKAQPNCEKPGRNILDPYATPIQLGFVKEQTALSFELLLAKEGVGLHERTCMANRIRYASDAQALELTNGSTQSQEALLLRLIGPCR